MVIKARLSSAKMINFQNIKWWGEGEGEGVVLCDLWMEIKST